MVPTTNKEEWKKAYQTTVEALERVEAMELMGMTDEETLGRIASLSVAESPWRERPNWSGLIEQQALFQKRKKP